MLSGQPGLFSGLDCNVSVVRAARDYIHTGSTTSRHHQDAAKIIAAAALGWSERKIARKLGHSRNTVGPVLRAAERAGKLEPVRERVVAAVAAAVHADIEKGNAMAENYLKPDALAALASFRRATWVGAQILAEKVLAPQASVTVNVGPGSVVQVVQEYQARLDQLRNATPSRTTPTLSSDGESVDAPPASGPTPAAVEGGGVTTTQPRRNTDG